MCARCDELELQVERYKRELMLRAEDGSIIAIRRAFRLTHAEARLVLILYGAKGRPVSSRFLVEEILSEQTFPQALKVHVTRARKKLEAEAIETHFGVGYAMSPMGLAKITGALQVAEAA